MHARSYLGFGLMAGRAAVLAWEETRAANPCIPADHSGTYEYAGAVHELTSHPDGASFGTCSKLITMVLKLETDCGAPRVRARMIFFAGRGGGLYVLDVRRSAAHQLKHLLRAHQHGA